MPQLDQLSACPSCAEPLVEGDRFCGACGAELPRPPEQRAPETGTAEADFLLAPARPRSVHDDPAPGESAEPTRDVPGEPTRDVPGQAARGADPRTVPADAPPPPTAPPAPEPSGGPRCVACGTGAVDGAGFCEHCGHEQPRERDHMETELPGVAAASDRGLRHHRNEDYYAVAGVTTPEGAPATIAVVCDGVSSATRPDDASAAAARAAEATLREAVPAGTHPQRAMYDALVAAAEAVNALAAEGPNEPTKNAPACTIVGALSADGILTVGWVGDSRAYWVPDDRTTSPARLTEDDSWAAQVVAAGLMSEAEAYADARAHAITGWLGADAYELDPHTASFQPDRSGVVLLCTDGLWNYAETAEEMAAVVPPDARERPMESARRLIGYALDGGGHDNVTVALVPFALPGEGESPA